MPFKDSNAKEFSFRRDLSTKDPHREKGSPHELLNQPEKEVCDSSAPRNGRHSRTKNYRFKSPSRIQPKRVYELILSKKSLIGSFLMLSLIFHFALVQGIYFLSHSKDKVQKRQETKKVTFKITLPEELQKPEQAVSPKPAQNVRGKGMPAEVEKTVKPEVKVASPQQLVSLGQSHMAMVREGTFPPLTLSYDNPTTYVSELYRLGAKTVLYEEEGRGFYEIDLLGTDILPLSRNDFKGFSFVKRVIKDPEWDQQRVRAASRLKTSSDSLAILLLVPLSVETRWIGHQVSIFRQLNLQISDIETVDAQFKNGRLKLVRLHLKDGSSRMVTDYGCG